MSAWRPACQVEQVPVERGVAVLLDGKQVALFRSPHDELFAVSNLDPFSGAMVVSRGIVGSRGERATVASPVYKQVFDLATGQCLDDPTVVLARFPVRVVDGMVEVAIPA